MIRALPIFREAGADFNHKNKVGKSILQLAKEKKLGAGLLEEYGAKE